MRGSPFPEPDDVVPVTSILGDLHRGADISLLERVDCRSERLIDLVDLRRADVSADRVVPEFRIFPGELGEAFPPKCARAKRIQKAYRGVVPFF